MERKMMNAIARRVALLWIAVPVAVLAEPPQEFAKQIAKLEGVAALINLREDGAFGSVAISLDARLVADREKLDQAAQAIGRYAAGEGLQVYVVTPTREDNDHIVTRIKAAGVGRITRSVMVEPEGSPNSRVFLTPDAGEKAR